MHPRPAPTARGQGAATATRRERSSWHSRPGSAGTARVTAASTAGSPAGPASTAPRPGAMGSAGRTPAEDAVFPGNYPVKIILTHASLPEREMNRGMLQGGIWRSPPPRGRPPCERRTELRRAPDLRPERSPESLREGALPPPGPSPDEDRPFREYFSTDSSGLTGGGCPNGGGGEPESVPVAVSDMDSNDPR